MITTKIYRDTYVGIVYKNLNCKPEFRTAAADFFFLLEPYF